MSPARPCEATGSSLLGGRQGGRQRDGGLALGNTGPQTSSRSDPSRTRGPAPPLPGPPTPGRLALSTEGALSLGRWPPGTGGGGAGPGSWLGLRRGRPLRGQSGLIPAPNSDRAAPGPPAADTLWACLSLRCVCLVGCVWCVSVLVCSMCGMVCALRVCHVYLLCVLYVWCIWGACVWYTCCAM